MGALVVDVIEDPAATRMVTLSATVQRAIRVPRAVAGQMSGMYVYASAECRYKVLPGGEAAADDTLPTTDYDVIPAATRTPIPLPVHQPAAEDGSYVIHVWSVSGTPTLHIQPYALTR